MQQIKRLEECCNWEHRGTMQGGLRDQKSKFGAFVVALLKREQGGKVFLVACIEHRSVWATVDV